MALRFDRPVGVDFLPSPATLAPTRLARPGLGMEVALGVAALSIWCCGPAHGQTTTAWLTPSGNAWASPTAWSNGAPPLAGNVLFGVDAGTTPFVVTIDATVSVGTIHVQNQSPTLAFVNPSTFWLILSNLTVSGPTEPTLTLDGGLGNVLDGGTVRVGSVGTRGRSGDAGHLVLTGGASLLTQGVKLHSGSITVESESLLGTVSLHPGLSSRYADGGVASLTVRGSVEGPAGTLVGINGGSATVLIEPQGSLALGFYGMALGGSLSAPPVGFAADPGLAELIVDGGSVSGGSILRVGREGEALLRLRDGASVTTPIWIGTGLGGGPGLRVESDATVGNLFLSYPDVPGQGVIEPGATLFAAAVRIGHDQTPSSGGITPTGLTPGTLTLGAGATLACDSVLIEELGSLVFAAAGAAVEASGDFRLETDDLTLAGLGTHVTCGSLTILPPTPSAVFLVDDQASVTAKGIQFGDASPFLWTIDNGAQCSFTEACDLATPFGLSGGDPSNTVSGTLSLHRGGSLAAASLLQGRDVVLHWTLGPHLAAQGAPVVASSAVLRGRLDIDLEDGYQPPVGERLPLLDAGSGTLDADPFSIDAAMVGDVPLVVVQDEGGLAAYAIAGVTSLVPTAPSEIHAGDAFAMQVLLTAPLAKGTLVADVTAQCTWSFEPLGIITWTSPTEFAAIGTGRVVATAHFGGATGSPSGSVVFDVGEGAPPTAPFVLVSGKADMGTLTWGDDESGWMSAPGGTPNIGLGLGARSLSKSGSSVVFATEASNFSVAGANPGLDVYVRSIQGNGIELVSYGPGEIASGGAFPSISADGRYVVYRSGTGSVGQIVVRDRFTQSSEVALRRLDGSADVTGRTSRISDDGRFVLCESWSDAIVPGDTNGTRDVFLVDRFDDITVRVSQLIGGGQLVVESTLGDLSADGRYAIFLRSSGGHILAYRYDSLLGEVTLATPGANGAAPANTISQVSLSADGRWLAFVSTGPTPMVAAGDEPSPVWAQAYCRDLVHGVTYGLSRTNDGAWATAPIEGCALSRDGRRIVVSTKATNLVPDAAGIGNGLARVLVRDLLTGIWSDRSESDAGAFNAPVTQQLAIADAIPGVGVPVAFTTKASNVMAGDLGQHIDAFAAFIAEPSLGDLNADGTVGPGDLAILLGSWGGHADAPWLHDLDGDGTVGAGDVAVLLGGWSP